MSPSKMTDLFLVLRKEAQDREENNQTYVFFFLRCREEKKEMRKTLIDRRNIFSSVDSSTKIMSFELKSI